ncbi:hypothetical protein SDC9_152001 [bioreactor metagenome]|uniref:Uncharacterized protein n=1 Tax=bioreactor metagenome TaxID=1076179 RepID=A0A645EWB1_9ZZZZ
MGVEGGRTLESGLGREVHDLAGLVVFDPVPAHPAVCQEHARRVDFQGAVPFVQRHVHNLVGRPQHRRINENVHGAEFLDCELEQRINAVFLRGVALEGICAAFAAGSGHVGHAGFCLFIVAGIGDDHLGAFLNQP